LKLRVNGISSLLAAFVIHPIVKGGLNVLVLALLGTATEQNHKRCPILAEIHSVARSEIDPAFIYACTREYLDLIGRSPFAEWFDRLNSPAAAKVTTALVRLEQGNFSNARGVDLNHFLW
jgi:hypothetical protein